MTGRIAIAAGLALAAGLLASGRPVGPMITRAIGGTADPSLTFDVRYADGPVPLDEVGPIWRRRMPVFGVTWQPHDDAVRVKVAGARLADGPFVARALALPGRIEMYAVIDDAPVMRDAYQQATAGRWPDVAADIDGWRHDDSGRSYSDYFLISHDRAALDAAIAEVPVVADERIVVESITPREDAEDRRPFWRTYLIGGARVLGNEQIASAVVIWDPQTNRPEVLIELDETGTLAFGEATSAWIGHKLAILLDDNVMSAPVIQSPIRGGRSNISMGGGSAAEQQAQAEALVAALTGNGPPLPVGLTPTLVASYQPAASMEWAVRLAAAALGGILTWLLAGAIARRRWLVPTPRSGRSVASAGWRLALTVAITVAVPVVLWLAERVRAPGVRTDVAMGVAPSIVSLGLAPALLAFLLVELVALAVPALNRRRRGPADGRTGIDRAVLWVMLGIAAVLAWDRAELLGTYGDFLGVVLVSGKLERAVLVISLVAGAMLQVVGARVITRWGLCNGWIVLIGVEALRRLLRVFDDPHAVTGAHATVAAVALACATAASALSLQRAGGRRQPGAGIAPLLIVPALLAIIVLPFVREVDQERRLYVHLDTLSATVQLAAYLAIAAGLAWWGGARRPAAFVAPLLFTFVLAGLGVLVTRRTGGPHPELLGAIAGIALVELGIGLLRRVRMADAAPLVALHDPDRADDLAEALTAAGIPAIVAGAGTRALLRGWGSFSPAVVYVSAARLGEARLVLLPVRDPLAARAVAVFE